MPKHCTNVGYDVDEYDCSQAYWGFINVLLWTLLQTTVQIWMPVHSRVVQVQVPYQEMGFPTCGETHASGAASLQKGSLAINRRGGRRSICVMTIRG